MSDENKSLDMPANLAELGRKVDPADEDFVESNLMHNINATSTATSRWATRPVGA